MNAHAAIPAADQPPCRAVENRRLYRRIGDFLTRHGLDPTPANFALVHSALTDPESPAARAVAAATADGVRLTQREADRIGAESDVRVPRASVRELEAKLLADARRQLDDIGNVVENARNAARDYGNDLAASAGRLHSSRSTSVVELIRITRAMIDRTKLAETQLAAAREEARSLREKLVQVEGQARSDPLTRLPNRRAFEDRVARLEALRIRHSIAICDIDRFKQVNDTHGHGVGDRVLRMVADTLAESCEGHMVARLGGEEFVVLFESVEVRAAAAIVDRARESLASRDCKVRETDVRLGAVTFSAGVALGGVPGAESTLKRADALLYEAKNAGRNRVRWELRPPLGSAA